MTYLIAVLIAVPLALCISPFASGWMDTLYKEGVGVLSFPESIARRARFRRLLLPLGYFLVFFLSIWSTYNAIGAWTPLAIPAFFLRAVTGVLLWTMSMTDLEQYVLFNRMMRPLIFLGLFSALPGEILQLAHYGAFPDLMAALGTEKVEALRMVLLPGATDAAFPAAFISGAIALALATLTQGGIGGGDVKLLFALGLLLGGERMLSTVFLGSIAGGVGAFLYLFFLHGQRKDALAYGPYFAVPGIFFLMM